MAELKSVRFSLGISQRSRFAADFAAGAAHQNLTTFIDQATLERAATVLVGGRNWQDYWDDSAAVRTLRVMADTRYPHAEETLPLRDMVLAHKSFFFDGVDVARFRAEVLWPKVQHYAELWQTSKHAHPLQTGEKMAEALKRANLKWPPK